MFSSNPIPGNAVSVSQVVNQLTRVGANVLVNSPLTSLHTTGHGSQEEQKLMLQLIQAEILHAGARRIQDASDSRGKRD